MRRRLKAAPSEVAPCQFHTDVRVMMYPLLPGFLDFTRIIGGDITRVVQKVSAVTKFGWLDEIQSQPASRGGATFGVGFMLTCVPCVGGPVYIQRLRRMRSSGSARLQQPGTVVKPASLMRPCNPNLQFQLPRPRTVEGGGSA